MAVGYPSFRSMVRRRHYEISRFVACSARRRSDQEEQLESERERVEREQCGDLVLAWRGHVSPFLPSMPMEEVRLVVSDLDEDRPVRILTNGALAHYDGCGGSHSLRTGLRSERIQRLTFEIEIAYRRPPGCPISRSLCPRINRDHPLGAPPHLLNTVDALCVLFPADRAWVWGQHGVRDYANYTAIWLAKHLAWLEARERGVGIEEAWPGSVVGHDPFVLPRLLSLREPCRCGSGKYYGACCAGIDAAARLELPPANHR